MPPRRRRELPITDPEELLTALGCLDERDRTVLQMRYGLAGQRIHNLRETAKVLAIPRERVRQLEARAVGQLAGLTGLSSAISEVPGEARLAHADSAGGGSRRDLTRRWTLLLLASGPAHVYELRKRFADLGIPRVSYRSLYEFEQDGLVRSAWVTGGRRGPDRRVYTLTDDGAQRLQGERELLENLAHTLDEFLAGSNEDESDCHGSKPL